MKRKLLSALVGLTLAGSLALTGTAHAQAKGAAPAGKLTNDTLKIGVLTDMSGVYADYGGPGAVMAARMAVEDFGGKMFGKPIEVVSADHQNKPDIAKNVTLQWFDRDGVDATFENLNSGVALAVTALGKEKNRITVVTGAATARLTNEDCAPGTGIHYLMDTIALGNVVGKAIVKDGGNTWYFLTADYAFGHSLEKDTGEVVKAAGGKVLGAARHPSPGTTDFSSYLLQAQASGAKIIGLANAGSDTVNCIKQAKEFGITPKQTLAGLLVFITDVHALGLASAKGLYLTESFYWDLNDETRKWSKRFQSHPDNKKKAMPSMIQAGLYSGITHYLQAIKAVGTDAAEPVIAKMKATPVNDFFAHNGIIGPDGLHRHDMYLFQVKSPEESKYPWDYYKLVKKIPAAEAFPTVEMQKCPLVVKK